MLRFSSQNGFKNTITELSFGLTELNKTPFKSLNDVAVDRPHRFLIVL